MLEVEGLAKHYKHKAVFQDVELILQRGDKVAVVGVNGAGKTTLVKIIAGLIEPDRGDIAVSGRAVGGMDPRERRSLGLAHIPEDRLKVGVVAAFPAKDNAILGYHDRAGYNRGPFTRPAAIQAWPRVRQAEMRRERLALVQPRRSA